MPALAPSKPTIAEETLRSAWDRKPRLDSWMVRLLGAPDTLYVRTVSRLFILGMVARAMAPGARIDCMLVLQGPQGCGKSTALRELAGPLYADVLAGDLTAHSCLPQLAQAWLVEVAELDAFAADEVAKLKQFITASSDRYRPAYESEVKRVPRTAVLVATATEDGALMAGRRFWVVPVTRADLAGIRWERLQLFAEAATRMASGMSHLPGAVDQATLDAGAEAIHATHS